MSKVEHYRRLAAETRQLATTVAAQDIKEALEKIAQGYDELAEKIRAGSGQ